MEISKITIPVKCRCCGTEYKIRVYPEDLSAFNRGDKLVQEAFPYLSPDDRELLLTRTCPVCWDKLFSRYDD